MASWSRRRRGRCRLQQGCFYSYKPSALYCYDPVAASWSSAPASTMHKGGAIVAAGGTVLVAGGYMYDEDGSNAHGRHRHLLRRLIEPNVQRGRLPSTMTPHRVQRRTSTPVVNASFTRREEPSSTRADIDNMFMKRVP